MVVNTSLETEADKIEILHVDDDPSVLELTGSFLCMELGRANITTATSSDEGLDQLAENTFHCIISDYDMPGRDGLELLADVREQHPNLPFILYTGYLQKGGPDQLQRLTNRVKHAAKEHRTQIESERYSTVLSALGYPIYIVNSEAEFEYVNRAFIELTGYDRDEIIGSSPGLIKTEEDVIKANEMLSKIVSSTGPDRQKFRVDIQTANGQLVPCYDHMAALPFSNTFRGSVGILRDATTEMRQREEILRQNERLDEFVSVISHDLRTPLASAKSAAALAERTDNKERFDQLKEAHDRIESMIEELLTLARQGCIVSDMEPVDIVDVASDAWKAFSSPENTLEAPDGKLIVNGDQARLRQLVENIMRNAVEHSPHPVTVTVDRQPSGFYISDNGPGIDESRRSDVFDSGYTTADEGSGFGLSIVERIVDAHGWEVKIADSNTGGTRFEFVTKS